MDNNKLEKLSHYAIIIIALSALFVSFFQTRIQHKHNKLSVKPILESSIEQQYDDTLSTVFVINRGVGPAIIKSFKFTYKGKTYNSLEEYLLA